MFQRDYLNVPKLHEGKLRIDHVEKIVRSALARWTLAGDDRGEDHTDPRKGIFVVNAVPNLFHGQSPDRIARLNNLMQRCSKDDLKNTVVRLCESLQEDDEQEYITNDAADEIEVLDIYIVRKAFYAAHGRITHSAAAAGYRPTCFCSRARI
jgi:hypothetical protein